MPGGDPDPELVEALSTREHELPTHTLSPEAARAQRRGRHVPPEQADEVARVRDLGIEGSGGKGTHTGGRGQRVRLTVDEAAHVSVMAERTRAGAPGRNGGEAGKPGRVVLEGEQLEAKVAFGMRPGQEVELDLPGGGGFGAT